MTHNLFTVNEGQLSLVSTHIFYNSFKYVILKNKSFAYIFSTPILKYLVCRLLHMICSNCRIIDFYIVK